MKLVCYLLIAGTVMLSACSGARMAYDTMTGNIWRIEMDYANRPMRYVDEKVKLPVKPEIYVMPQSVLMRPATAVMFPLQVRQDIQNRKHLGVELGRMFWQTWVRDRIFPVFEYAEDHQWSNVKAAVAEARGMGAALAVTGEITRLFAGGTVGYTELAMRLNVYDTASGELIWSMEHTGMLSHRITQDYILFTQKSRLPSSPFFAITTAVAVDLASPVKEWMMASDKAAEGGGMLDAPQNAPVRVAPPVQPVEQGAQGMQGTQTGQSMWGSPALQPVPQS